MHGVRERPTSIRMQLSCAGVINGCLVRVFMLQLKYEYMTHAIRHDIDIYLPVCKQNWIPMHGAFPTFLYISCFD